MKKKSNNITAFSILLLIVVISNCQKSSINSEPNTKSINYYCPMDTQIVSKTEGKCPICKMKLELKTDVSIQKISTDEQVLSSQGTFMVSSANFSNRLSLSGITVIASDRNKSVPAKFGGRIEKLYIKYNFKYIREGEKIMEIYNPELIAMQEEYLFLLKSNNENNLLQKSRQKLILSGISDKQVNEIENLRKVKKTITIYSPYSGFVIFKSKLPSESNYNGTETDGGMKMKKDIITQENFDNSAITEGSYVSNRTTLFEVNDLREIWLWLSVPVQLINQITYGMPVNVKLENGLNLKSKISQIEKNTDNTKSKFARVRVSLNNNDNRILINSLANAEITTNNSENILIPRQSVVFTGISSLVWLKTGTLKNGNGIFKIIRIITGEISNNMVTVISGLKIGDEIALNANLMTDSETILD